MNSLPSFDEPKLAAAVEALTDEQRDALPFGAIGLDPAGIVRVYSNRERALSGNLKKPVIGKTFFTDIAPCMNNGYFLGRIEKARAAGTLDIAFAFTGDYSDRDRELRVRVQSASDGGTWIFMQRPVVAAQ